MKAISASRSFIRLLISLSITALVFAFVYASTLPRAYADEVLSTSPTAVDVTAQQTLEEDPITLPGALLPNQDVLLEAYIEQKAETVVSQALGYAEQGAQDSEEPPAYARYWKLGQPERNAYRIIREQLTRIAAGEESNTSIAVRFDQVFTPEQLAARYTADDLGVDSLVVQNEDASYSITDEASDALGSKFVLNRAKILSALLLDCPDLLYWFDKTIGLGGGTGLRVSAGMSASAGWFIQCTNDSVFNFVFNASGDYAQQGIDSETGMDIYYLTTLDPNKTTAVSTAIDNASSVVTGAASLSDYQKLVTYRDDICGRVEYDDEAPKMIDRGEIGYGNPWQMVGVFDDNPTTNVVCEGYAKAFKLLADLTRFDDQSIAVHIVTGNMDGATGEGGHMWNLVTVGSKNYLVDVTNCDEGTVGSPDKLFMKGNNDMQRIMTTEEYDGVEQSYETERYIFAIPTNMRAMENVTYLYDYDTVQLYNPNERYLATTDYEPDDSTDPADAQDISDFETRFSDNLHINEDATNWALYFIEGAGATVTPQITVEGNGSVLPASAYTITYERSLGFDENDEELFEPAEAPFGLGSYRAFVQGNSAEGYTGELGPLWFNVQDAHDLASRFADVFLTKGESYQHNINPMNDDYYVIPLSKTAEVLNSLEVRTGGETSRENPHAGELVDPENYTVTYYPAKVNAAYSEVQGGAIDGAALSGVPTKAGAYVMVVEGKDPYYGAHEILIDVQVPMSSTTVSSIPAQTYNGAAHKPELTVEYDGNTLVEGTDYTVTYSNNVAPGKASATITDAYPIKENKTGQPETLDEGRFFAGVQSTTFTINPLPPTNLQWLEENDRNIVTWTGVDGATVYYVELRKDGSWYGTFATEADPYPDTAGTQYFIDMTRYINDYGTGDYSFHASARAGNETDFIYSDITDSEVKRFIVTQDISDFETRFSDDLHINEDATNWALYFIEGAGATVTPQISVEGNGSVLPASAYTITYERSLGFDENDEEIFEPAEAPFGLGSYRAFVQGNSAEGYTGEIGPLWFDVQDAHDLASQFADVFLTKGESYQHNINPMNDDYYVIPLSKTAEVLNSLEVRTGGETSRENPHAGELVDPENHTVTYYPAKVNAAYGEVQGGAIDGAALSGVPTKAGAYVMVVEGKDPYYGAHEILIDVQVPMSSTTVSSIPAQTYNGAAHKPKLTVKYNGKTLTEGTDFSVTYKNNVNAGTATATIKGLQPVKENTNGKPVTLSADRFFTGTKSVTFKINPASIAKASVSGVSNKTETGKAITQTPTVKLAVGGKTVTLKSGSDYTLSYKNNVKPGTATMTVTGKGNFTGTKAATFKITKKASTIKEVGVYWIVSKKTGENLYTTDANEVRVLTKVKKTWTNKGIIWYAPDKGTPVYRLVSLTTGDHHFTMDANEVRVLTKVKKTWRADFSGKPIFYSGGSKQVWRLWSEKLWKANKPGTHRFATYNAKLSGWKNEGVKMYAVRYGNVK